MSISVLTVERDNGEVIPLPTPNSLSWNLSDLDAEGSGRSKKGNMFRDRVAIKRKLGISWEYLNAADTSKTLTAVSDIFFYLRYPDAMTGGFRRMRCYVGDRTAPNLQIKGDGDDVDFFWDGMSCNIIER